MKVRHTIVYPHWCRQALRSSLVNLLRMRKHSSRMHTACLPTVHVLVAATRCQYQLGEYPPPSPLGYPTTSWCTQSPEHTHSSGYLASFLQTCTPHPDILILPPGHSCPPSIHWHLMVITGDIPTPRMTDTCENITFPQLHWRVVNIYHMEGRVCNEEYSYWWVATWTDKFAHSFYQLNRNKFYCISLSHKQWKTVHLKAHVLTALVFIQYEQSFRRRNFLVLWRRHLVVRPCSAWINSSSFTLD